MAVQRNTNTAGLWISPSTLQAPVGSYVLADNCVINSPGIVEPRRGYSWIPYDLSGIEGTYSKASFSFRGTLIVHHGFKLSYNSGSAFVDYTGDYVAPNPSVLRMKAAEQQLNFYFTSDTGVYEIDAPTGNPIAAGVARGPTPTSVLNKTDIGGVFIGGWMPEDSQVAYVATFFRVDANDTPREGTPSNPVVVVNPAGSGDQAVTVYVQVSSTFCSAGDTVLVYRTKVSGSESVPPRPQYYLDQEYVITATDLTNGYFTYIDRLSDSLLQDPLYTNTDDGEPPDSSLQNDNSQPPLCTDLVVFDQRLWGANYEELQILSFSLLATDAPNGVQPGDTITIGSITYTGIVEGGTPGATQFRVYTSSDPGTNVAKTAQELALAATSASSTIDVFYTSGLDDLPGQMLARNRSFVGGGVPFSIYVSRPSAWNPVFTTSASGAVTSTAVPATNGLWFSKQNQPEAVPLLNRLSIGPKNANILRIAALRDKLFVFTDISGAYVVSNSYPYQITSLSATAVLQVADSLVNFDDAIYALTTQGVVRFTEAGPTILSVPIESEIKALYGSGLPTLRKRAFAVGYESYRKYLLYMPTSVEDSNNTETWVYDVVTKAWTRWTKPVDSGVVIPQTDLMYVTTPASVKVSQERKNFNRTDNADEDFSVSISSSTDETVEVTATIAPTVGALLYQTPIVRALVTAVENTGVNTYTLTVDSTVGWTVGTTTLFPGIQNTLLNTPVFATGPEERKNFREVTYHFRTPGFSLGEALFSGDINPAIYSATFGKGGWGDVPFGLFAWEQPARPVNKRVSIPTPVRRVSYLSVGFSICEAQAQWQLMGVTPVFENMSERNTK